MLKNFIDYEKQTYFYIDFEIKTYGVVIGKKDIDNSEDVIKKVLEKNKKRIKDLKQEWEVAQHV